LVREFSKHFFSANGLVAFMTCAPVLIFDKDLKRTRVFDKDVWLAAVARLCFAVQLGSSFGVKFKCAGDSCLLAQVIGLLKLLHVNCLMRLGCVKCTGEEITGYCRAATLLYRVIWRISACCM
jgi:hypothetical protein